MRNEKLHAVVARSAFQSQNVQNTPGLDHFWKLRCRKIERRCGAKHISKSKFTKHTIPGLGPLLEVNMKQKCTLLWREAHLQKSKCTKPTSASEHFWKIERVVARSTFPSQNVQSTSASEHFCKLRCRKSARCCGAKHKSKSKVLKSEGFGPLFDVQLSKKCTLLWREAHVQVKGVKQLTDSAHFFAFTLSKVSKA